MIGPVHLHQPKSLHQTIEGPIRGSVVHHNHLEMGVIDLQCGANAVHDDVLLVPGRNDNGHWRGQGRMAQGIEALISHLPLVHPSGAQREQHEECVDSVGEEEVRKYNQVKYRDQVVKEGLKVVVHR